MIDKKFILTQSELLIYVDVDETLIFTSDKDDHQAVLVDYYGVNKWVKPHNKHIRFLKSLKNRGYYVIVHSANGWKWANEIIEKFSLYDYIDEIKTKPIKYIDDQPSDKWFGQRIYLQDDGT